MPDQLQTELYHFIKRERARKTQVRFRDPAIEALTAKWDLEDEALGFIRMFNRGEAGPEKIKADVVMTDRQEAIARTEFPRHYKKLREIKRHRWHTWTAICNAMLWQAGTPPNLAIWWSKKGQPKAA